MAKLVAATRRALPALLQGLADLLGETYSGGSDARSDFHFEFVPSVLRDLEKWANEADEGDLATAVSTTRGRYPSTCASGTARRAPARRPPGRSVTSSGCAKSGGAGTSASRHSRTTWPSVQPARTASHSPSRTPSGAARARGGGAKAAPHRRHRDNPSVLAGGGWPEVLRAYDAAPAGITGL